MNYEMANEGSLVYRPVVQSRLVASPEGSEQKELGGGWIERMRADSVNINVAPQEKYGTICCGNGGFLAAER